MRNQGSLYTLEFPYCNNLNLRWKIPKEKSPERQSTAEFYLRQSAFFHADCTTSCLQRCGPTIHRLVFQILSAPLPSPSHYYSEDGLSLEIHCKK